MCGQCVARDNISPHKATSLRSSATTRIAGPKLSLCRPNCCSRGAFRKLVYAVSAATVCNIPSNVISRDNCSSIDLGITTLLVIVPKFLARCSAGTSKRSKPHSLFFFRASKCSWYILSPLALTRYIESQAKIEESGAFALTLCI